MEEERIDDELLDLDDVLAPEEASSDTGQLYEHFRVEVDKGQEPERIDKYLSVRMQHSSRNRIQKAADAGIHPRQWHAGKEQLQGASRGRDHLDAPPAEARHEHRGGGHSA